MDDPGAQRRAGRPSRTSMPSTRIASCRPGRRTGEAVGGSCSCPRRRGRRSRRSRRDPTTEGRRRRERFDLGPSRVARSRRRRSSTRPQGRRRQFGTGSSASRDLRLDRRAARRAVRRRRRRAGASPQTSATRGEGSPRSSERVHHELELQIPAAHGAFEYVVGADPDDARSTKARTSEHDEGGQPGARHHAVRARHRKASVHDVPVAAIDRRLRG